MTQGRLSPVTTGVRAALRQWYQQARNAEMLARYMSDPDREVDDGLARGQAEASPAADGETT